MPDRIPPTLSEPDLGPIDAVEVQADELEAFGDFLNSIQSFVMSLDFRIRHIEALIYQATDTEVPEVPPALAAVDEPELDEPALD